MAVVGVGQCAWDTLAVVDRFPQIDTKKEVLTWDEQGGGTLGNEMAALSRLGVPCRFHCVVSDDREGAAIRQSLADEGVDITGVVTRTDTRSQKAFIVIDRSAGTRTIFWNRPSGEPLRQDELPPDFLRGADFLLLDGVMKDISLFAAREARKAGVPVMLDAGKTRDWMLELARLCNYVIASEEFARDMLGWKEEPSSFRQEVGKRGLRTTTVTLGSRGSVTFAGDEIISCPAFPVDVVDTTGAGDAFHAGYLYGLIHKLPLKDTIRFASAAAALACRKVGARAGLPPSPKFRTS
ncbi:MAG: sugar kinase [Nitrospirae bacterium]|nr:sugar kinase [Nitrospirota bacterium]NTW65099.1 sugar kinase [Nitrospirota bacterium]